MFNNKCVLITGAAGSIGSALADFILLKKPSKIILLDNAETPLFKLEQVLRLKLPIDTQIEFVLGSITNKPLIEKLFANSKIDFVFHTAAYKHVPVLEKNPIPGVEVNCIGTKILADGAIKYNVKNFLFVSTDKAVEPANVMGATKLLAEKYIGALSKQYMLSTRFVTLRFGNVIGSNGSVIPLFKEQLLLNKKLTLTDVAATRYFINVSKVVSLAIESLKFAISGSVFLIEMGAPKSILSIAKQTISELNLNEAQVDIEIIGLRPGEKLHETLVGNQASLKKTEHPEIYLIKETETLSFEEITEAFKVLQHIVNQQDDIVVVQYLKSLLKTFKSRNSQFESLD
jgi:FlaA1/EpsC-like NDP-sugar epimerase